MLWPFGRYWRSKPFVILVGEAAFPLHQGDDTGIIRAAFLLAAGRGTLVARG